MASERSSLHNIIMKRTPPLCFNTGVLNPVPVYLPNCRVEIEP